MLQERYEEAARPRARRCASSTTAGDVSGITLALDVLSVVALAAGRAPPRGPPVGRGPPAAAGQRDRASPSGTRASSPCCPSACGASSAPTSWRRSAAQGARLSLSDAVAYAFGEVGPLRRGRTPATSGLSDRAGRPRCRRRCSRRRHASGWGARMGGRGRVAQRQSKRLIIARSQVRILSLLPPLHPRRRSWPSRRVSARCPPSSLLHGRRAGPAL